jgi:hypothetical protein
MRCKLQVFINVSNIASRVFPCSRSIRGLCCINSILGRDAHIFANQ